MLSCEQHVADCDLPAPISSRVCDRHHPACCVTDSRTQASRMQSRCQLAPGSASRCENAEKIRHTISLQNSPADPQNLHVTNGQTSPTLNQGFLERGEAPPIGLPDTDQGLDGILFWRRNLLAWDLWAAMQMYQCDVVAQEADVLNESFESAALKTRLKELLVRGCNGQASLEGGSIPENIISIFCEGGSVGLSITLVPPILAHLKEVV
jgi:hypothetical protein